MPYINVNDIKIYYEIHGPSDGFPLVLLEGWGVAIWTWFRQLESFSQKYKVIIFDNRGAGKTSKPDEEYSIQMFADDAKGLLDALGIKHTHVLGISMGGYIAQQLTISHPEMVAGLAISSTAFGAANKRAIQASDKMLAAMFTYPTETISLEQAMAIRRSTAWSEEFLNANKPLLNQMDRWVLDNPQPDYARGRQAQASLDFDSESHLHEIKSPTLILHGQKDKVVPPENADMLLELIPNSKLVFFEDGPHRIEVERHTQFNQTILDFYEQVDSGTFIPEPKRTILPKG